MVKDFLQLILILGLLALVVFALWFFIFKVKHLKTSDVYFVDGGVKVGKSKVCVMLVVKKIFVNRLRAHIRNGIIALLNIRVKRFNKKHDEDIKKGKVKAKVLRKKCEIPMLYSNMPLYRVKYNHLDLKIIECQVRVPYGSVCLLDEASLIADSMTAYGKTKTQQEIVDYVNEKLTIFLKLFGHATHGGFCVYNSQNVVDLHFAFRRCTSTYLFLSHKRRFPFFNLIDCREMVHDESGDVVNTIQKDVDDDNKPLFVRNKWHKYYDRYYLDILFKDLPVMVNYDVPIEDKRKHRIELKEITTLGNYKMIKEYNEKMKAVHMPVVQESEVKENA